MGGSEEQRLLRGAVERIGLRPAIFRAVDGTGKMLVERHEDAGDHDKALAILFAWLRDASAAPDAVGHRIVHGGNAFVQPHPVTEKLVKTLVGLTPLAPDHLPHEVGAITAVMRSYPALPQVACFDTAFHRHMPRAARIYPLPRFLEGEGVRRYGFHGLSYEYIMEELAREAGLEAARGRLIIAHLGNGASMAAVRDGKSVDTTMGFTPAGGLMMGARSGDLDPGVILYLLEEKGLRPSTVNDIVNRHAGLLAVSARTSDMEELLSLEATDPHAAEAVMLFCYQAKKFAGAMAAVLGGLETLVFTGGIGENAPAVRASICSGLAFLGVEIDPAANAENRPVISPSGSRATVRVMKTDEELMTARHTFNLLRKERVGRPPRGMDRKEA
jgi:acetate kinase